MPFSLSRNNSAKKSLIQTGRPAATSVYQESFMGDFPRDDLEYTGMGAACGVFIRVLNRPWNVRNQRTFWKFKLGALARTLLHYRRLEI